jgi:hypothetical protein
VSTGLALRTKLKQKTVQKLDIFSLLRSGLLLKTVRKILSSEATAELFLPFAVAQDNFVVDFAKTFVPFRPYGSFAALYLAPEPVSSNDQFPSPHFTPPRLLAGAGI